MPLLQSRRYLKRRMCLITNLATIAQFQRLSDRYKKEVTGFFLKASQPLDLVSSERMKSKLL
ncbi:hypothetical protein VCR6J2_310047 [Vibrio coralliirubri]|nr:hypothetical protein VCR6J2_310047 [Vibrio coralliirubri]